MTENHYLLAALGEGAAHGRRAVARALGGQAPGQPAALDADRSLAAANFLGYLMFTMQLAHGLHPRSAVDFVTGQDRGDELARGFLIAGTVEVCCDYCGMLMEAAIINAAAAQMHAIHGDSAAAQWETLSYALAGPPF